MDEFTLGHTARPSVVDTLAWRSSPCTVFVSCSLFMRKVARLWRRLLETETLSRPQYDPRPRSQRDEDDLLQECWPFAVDALPCSDFCRTAAQLAGLAALPFPEISSRTADRAGSRSLAV
jgi:hypothetical protein